MIEVIVKAGGNQIGLLHINRLGGEGVDYDSVFQYSAALRLHNVDKMPKVATFEHRYGDEWPIIVRKALEAIGIESCGQHSGSPEQPVQKTMERQYHRPTCRDCDRGDDSCAVHG